MKPDQVLTNPGTGASANAEFLTAVRELSTEDEIALERAGSLLEQRRIQLVLRMTAKRFGELSPVEKRNFKRWAQHFARVFGERASLFERNSPADIDLPTYLQAKG